jgi:hypothetical protein
LCRLACSRAGRLSTSNGSAWHRWEDSYCFQSSTRSDGICCEA